MIIRDHLGKTEGGGCGGAEFDVFLSHNARDKPVVERIAEQLRREGLRPFLDAWDLTAGVRWQRGLIDGLERSKTCALFVGPHAFGNWQLEELDVALVRANQRDGFRVFAVLLPGVEDPFDAQALPPFLSTRTWVDLRGGTSSRRALQRLLNAIMGVAPGPATPAKPVAGVVPYRGLESFREEDAEFFFGRERDVQRLLEILKSSPLLCVVGSSGCGKSSLVRAGLVPRLRNGALAHVNDYQVCLVRPGAHPLQALATQLAPLGSGSSMQATLDDLAADHRTLHLAVSLALGTDALRSRVLIVVDQLEEVFTLCNEERERGQFFANLLHAAFASIGQTLVVLTMRADFYARCADYPELAQRTARSLALIGPLDNEGLREAIEEPARGVGLFFESGLVQTILDDVGSDAGALPLLEHALLEVWRRRVGDQLTLDGYVQAGRVAGALAQRAESVFSSFTPRQQQIARRMLLRLTQPGEGTEDTRRRAPRRELRPPQADDNDNFEHVLGRLVQTRLLTTGRDETDQEVVDVCHEALIRGWPRLRKWIDADGQDLVVHRRLTNATAEWTRLQRDDSALYRGARLGEAQALGERNPDAFNDAELAFLEASAAREEAAGRKELDDARELAAAQRRAKRGFALVAFILLGAVIAATGLTIVAFSARNDAQRQRSDAQRQTARARSLALVSAAAPLLNSRPDVSLLLAFEAYHASPRPEARSALLSVLTNARDHGLLAILGGHSGPIFSVTFSPDGHMLASASYDNTIRLWDVRSHKQLGRPLIGHTNAVMSVAFSPDGHTLASASDDNTIRLWDVRTHKQLGAPLTRHHSDDSVVFSPDAHTLASSSFDDGTVRIWDVRTHKQVDTLLTRHNDEVFNVAFSPDGRMLASAEDKTIRLWDVRTHKQLGAPIHADENVNVAFSPDGRMLASASFDKTIRLWDVRTHKQLGAPLTGHTKLVIDVAFSLDGRTLASASLDKTLRLWDVRTHKQLGAPLAGHTKSVFSVAFSPDGRTLASAGEDDTIRLWEARTQKRIGTPITAYKAIGGPLVLSSDGRTLAFASGYKGTIRLWDVPTHKQLGAPLKAHTGPIYSVALSRDGRTLASAGEDKTVRLWDVRTHKQLGAPLKAHTEPIYSVSFSRDGRTLASAGLDKTVRLWDVRTHKQLGALVHPGNVLVAQFSPDGRTLASFAWDATVRFWDTRTHKQRGAPLPSHKDPNDDTPVLGYSEAFSPDGRTLASGSADKTIRLWDVRTHKPLGRPLTGHKTDVTNVAFSPDGRTLASSSAQDGTIRLWDVRTQQQLGTPLHTGPGYSVAFSADGRTLITVDGKIRLWKGLLWRNLGELRTEVCKLIGSGLSKSAWARYAQGIPYRNSCP
jgi:WD40 repeat protein